MKQIISMDRFRMRKLNQQLEKINQLADEMRALSDQELQAKTAAFKARLAAGETVDDLLIEAYALVREADYRVLGLYPYDVQVIGALVLHQGNVAEMKTGEGKTLTATMPLYLNALTGKGAFLIAPNDYLALRDYAEMGPVYRFLGLTVSVGVFPDPEKKAKPAEKRAIYHADIIYTTNGALGFDYLIHHLASDKEQQYMRPFHYAVIDEVDAVLMDMAQTPLVISGAPRVQSNLYTATDQFIQTLEPDVSYYHDKERKEIWLTQKGIDEAEQYFSLPQLHLEENSELVRHLTIALKATKTIESDKDYVVEGGKVKLLDQMNGRVLEGTKLQGGFHQALEEKEQVKHTEETRAMASITYQNLFLLFDKLAGMTGTGKTIEAEFIEIYQMEVIQIPTHKPIRRVDLPDHIFTTLPEKIVASIDYLKSVHATGRPILLVTGSVRMSELYSEILLLEGIPHNLLNAFNAAKEAQMIAEAGQLGNVTVATVMAGRGTDIKLGPGVEELGGLAIIGTERMKNKRMDLQVRGRAGRQGNPGTSQFFVSLEDELLTEYGGKWVQKYFKRYKDTMDAEVPQELRRAKFKRIIEQAQVLCESQGRLSRETTMKFDESVKVQRDLVYAERDRIIACQTCEAELMPLFEQCVADFLQTPAHQTAAVAERFVLDHIDYRFTERFPRTIGKKGLAYGIRRQIEQVLTRKKTNFLVEADYQSFLKLALLKAIDEAWIENVDYLQQLRSLVLGRQTAQRNPVFEYHREAMVAFEKMKEDIRLRTLNNVLLGEVSYTKKGEMEIYFA